MLALSTSMTVSPFLFAAGGLTSTQAFVGAVQQIRDLTETSDFIRIADALPPTNALVDSLREMDVPHDIIRGSEGILTELTFQVDQNPDAQIASTVFLNDLSRYGIIPLINEEPEQIAARLQKLTKDFGSRPGTDHFLQTTFVGEIHGYGFFSRGARRETEREPDGPQDAPITDKATTLVHPSSLKAPVTNISQGLHIKGRSDVRYEILEILGQGASGTVYRARDLMFDREVALKVVTLKRGAAAQRERELFLKLFRNEGRLQAGVKSRRIVVAYDTGITEDGEPFMVMEKMHGSFMDYVADVTTGKRPFNLEEIVAYAEQAIAAVCDLHKLGIIHKDIKPENLFIDDNEDLLVGDFGISERVEDISSEHRKELAGTPVYMSLEALEGCPPNYSTDVYALGVMLYEIFTGCLPFNMAGKTLYSHVFDKYHNMPIPPSQCTPERNIPKEIDRLILKALAMRETAYDEDGGRVPSQDRYHDAEALLFDLITYRAQAREAEASSFKKQATEILSQNKPNMDRVHHLMNNWKALLNKALDEYDQAYRRFPIDSIIEKTFDINLALARWADRSGDDAEREAIADRIANMAPNSEVLTRLRQGIFVQLSYDGDVDPSDKRFAVRVGASADNTGVLERQEVVSIKRGLPRELAPLERGYAYTLQVNGPGVHPVAIPLPARPAPPGERHAIRIPLYPRGTVPDDFLIVPAGWVAIREYRSRFSERIRREDWRPIPYDYAIGPKVTNAQYLNYLREMRRAILQQSRKRRSSLLRDFEATIPSHWHPDIRRRIADGNRVNSNQLSDRYGRRLYANAAVTAVTSLHATQFLNWTYDQFDVQIADLNEWKRAMRGNDRRRFPWGDRTPRGIANWSFSGLESEAAVLPNVSRSVVAPPMDLSPFSIFSEDGFEMGISWFVSGTRTLLRATEASARLILKFRGFDLKDPTELAQWNFVVGTPVDDAPPENVEIAKPVSLDDRSNLEETGIFPVIRLNDAEPTPHLSTLTN